ncbi:MAG: hypothetical protein GX905_09815 [Bacteroidales bacterium]|nr:hypothetical protein [Bacteroidales bacterium]
MKYIITYGLFFLLLFSSSCFRKKETDDLNKDNKQLITQKPAFNLSFPTDTFPLESEMLEGFIHNNTSMDFSFGSYYTLEHYKDSGWKTINYPKGISFNSMAYALPANDSVNIKIHLFSNNLNYHPGKYRVFKTVFSRFVQEFYVVDSLFPVVGAWKETQIKEKEYELILPFDTLVVGMDSISFIIKNNSNIEISPLTFYILQYYDEEHDRWLDYYYPSYKPGYAGVIEPGYSMNGTIHLNNKKLYRFSSDKELYQNRYFLRPGKYRLYKDIDVLLAKVFYLLP